MRHNFIRLQCHCTLFTIATALKCDITKGKNQETIIHQINWFDHLNFRKCYFCFLYLHMFDQLLNNVEHKEIRQIDIGSTFAKIDSGMTCGLEYQRGIITFLSYKPVIVKSTLDVFPYYTKQLSKRLDRRIVALSKRENRYHLQIKHWMKTHFCYHYSW